MSEIRAIEFDLWYRQLAVPVCECICIYLFCFICPNLFPDILPTLLLASSPLAVLTPVCVFIVNTKMSVLCHAGLKKKMKIKDTNNCTYCEFHPII